MAGCSSQPAAPAQSSPAPTTLAPGQPVWSERFDAALTGWGSPSGHDAATIARVYAVQGGALHARHDGREQASPTTPAVHYGRGFEGDAAPRLSDFPILTFRWRVITHPSVSADPWLDLAASIYVVIKPPSLLSGGRGFKLGFMARPAPEGTQQRGLLQVPLRVEAASGQWRSERIDLCAAYQAAYGGSCDEQRIRYIGVVTDADDTKSVAAAEYDDFELSPR
jgi:hypothetical protein